MPNILDIRRRIRSVTNTRQITKAMKMVSAAKLRRAQDRVIAARPYASLLRQMLSNVVAAVRAGEIVGSLAARTEAALHAPVILTNGAGGAITHANGAPAAIRRTELS